MDNPPTSPPGIQMHSLKRERPTAPAKSVIAAASSQEKYATAAASSHAVSSATTPPGNAPVEPSVKYRGLYVQKDNSRRPFAAKIHLTQVDTLHLGVFATAEEAARAFDSAARKYLVNPCCNFFANGTLNPNRNFRATRLLTRAGMEQVKLIQGRRAARDAQKAGSSASVVTNEAVGEASVSSEGANRDHEAEGEGVAGMEVEEEQASARGDRMQESEDEEETDEEEMMAVVNEEAAKRVSQSLPQQPPQQQPPPPQPQQKDHSQPAFSSAAAASATVTTSAVGRAAAVDVWVELKTAVFRKLMSVDGPALSEDEARKYEKLLHLLHEPTASLRGFVEDVVLRSGFSAEVADRAAGLLANMAATGGFDE